MELAYPFILIIGIIGLIILIFKKFRKIENYEDGKKVANTKYVKEIPYYKEVMRKYKILTNTIKCLCIVSIVMSLLLISRPSTLSEEVKTQNNRDIILCMDVSDSVNELNEKLVGDLKKVVKSLKGERFGVSIFNTSSVTLIPLTDDYEYVLEMLDTLQKNLKERINYLNYQTGNAYMATEYLHAGTIVGNEIRGSSIIGDGLASAINVFGDLNENRTRIIIFTTDNELYGKEIVTLKEAGEICNSKKITVFGIAPKTILMQDKAELKQVVELTGGTYYTDGEKGNISSIVDNIEKKGKSLIKGPKEVKLIDKPQIPFIILSLSLIGLCLLDKKVSI